MYRALELEAGPVDLVEVGEGAGAQIGERRPEVVVAELLYERRGFAATLGRLPGEVTAALRLAEGQERRGTRFVPTRILQKGAHEIGRRRGLVRVDQDSGR